MVFEALNAIVGLINEYISPGLTDEPLILANISKVNDGDDFTTNLQDKLVLSIVNIEEDRIAKTPENFIKQNSTIKYKNPPIPINITLLFAATHNYANAIPLLEKIIRFFQRKFVFTPSDTPELDQLNQINDFNIEKLIFEWINLDLEQVHQLWTTLGGHYMPSVVYKLRMLIIDENLITKETLPIKEINSQFGTI